MRHALVALLCALLVACGSVDGGGSRCEIGRSVACTCASGATGSQECSPAGVYGACVCTSADAGAEAATDAPALDVADVLEAPDAPDATSPADAGADALDAGQGGDASAAPDASTADASSADASSADASSADAAPADGQVNDGPSCASMTPGNCCGVACVATGAHVAGAVCVEGRCRVSCAAGFADCDHDPANGCEVAPATDAMNCGACGAPCGAGRRCVAGACVLMCSPYTADCDGNASNGCEADLTSVTSCGMCGQRCASALPGSTCLRLSPSATSFLCDCGAPRSTRCGGACVDTSTDPNNCGRCGRVCDRLAPRCVRGGCVA